MAAVEISKSCLKRLLADYKLITTSNSTDVDAVPDDNNMLIWYFLIIGPDDSDYKGGYYLGKLMHNPEYPMKAPDYMMLTPSGRFEIDKKICMTNTGYHSNDWSPMWNILTILHGFISIMLDDQEHGISHIKDSKVNRQKMAYNSMDFNRKYYPDIIKKFTRFIDENGFERDKKNIIMIEKKEKKNKKNNSTTNVEPKNTPEEIPEKITELEDTTDPIKKQEKLEENEEEKEEPVKKTPGKRVYKKKQVELEEPVKPEEQVEPEEPVKKTPVKRVYKKKETNELEQQEQVKPKRKYVRKTNN